MGFLKKLFGVEDRAVGHSSTQVAEAFYEVMRQYFDESVIGALHVASFKQGELMIECDHSFMNALNERSGYLVNKINTHLGEFLIQKMTFSVE